MTFGCPFIGSRERTMSNPRKQDAKAPGHYGNQGPQQEGERPSGQDRQEQYQRAKEKQHWERAAQDLDREDSEIQRGGERRH
jgi:hypothetical protein